MGNPFLEKVLIEACLELSETDLLVGLADLGAAGLTSSAVESAGRAGSGVDIDVGRVPRREDGMTPYEVMLSESQERMLLVVSPENKAAVDEITEKWDLHSDVIGRVTDDGQVKIRDDGELVADLPVDVLTDAPQYRIDGKKPYRLSALQAFDFDTLPLPEDGAESVLLKILASPNVASKEMVYRQYDHQVMTNTVVPPGSDAAVIRVKGRKRRFLSQRTGMVGTVSWTRMREEHRSGGGVEECGVCRGTGDSCYGLPELRKSGEARGVLPAGAVHTRHDGGLRGFRYAGDKWKRQSIQRDDG